MLEVGSELIQPSKPPENYLDCLVCPELRNTVRVKIITGSLVTLENLFPFKIQEKPIHKEFQGGGLRVPKILYALILCVFYLLPMLLKYRYRHRLEIRMFTITVTLLAPAAAPSFPLTPNYRLESHLNEFSHQNYRYRYRLEMFLN